MAGGRLAARYRRLLAWYPQRWRRENGDALMATLLDVAEGEGWNRVRLGDAVDLAVNGISARVSAVLPAVARDRAAGFAAATGLAWSLAYFLVEDWMPWSRAVAAPQWRWMHAYAVALMWVMPETSTLRVSQRSWLVWSVSQNRGVEPRALASLAAMSGVRRLVPLSSRAIVEGATPRWRASSRPLIPSGSR